MILLAIWSPRITCATITKKVACFFNGKLRRQPRRACVLIGDIGFKNGGRRMQPSDEGQTGSCVVPPSENEEGAC